LQITLPAEARPSDSSVRTEIQKATTLLEGEEGSANNFYVNLMHALGEHDGPRHRHDFDQVRYPLEGEFVYGEGKVLPQGWVGYFPEGTYYGPQLRRPGLLLFYSQFGGASGRGHLSAQQRKWARAELGKKGVVSKNLFSYTDSAGVPQTMDAHEAMAELVRGVREEYPAPRYHDVILMNPANFHWVADGKDSGVRRKLLGVFNERGTSISFIALEAGASLQVGMHTAPELYFLTEGILQCGGRLCPRHSAFATDPAEAPVVIAANEPSELLCIQLPSFSSAPSAA
jgi:hypothetical protein